MSFLRKIRFYASILFDRQTPWYVKLLITGGFFYLIVPIDFIPDTIPFIGLLDDVTIGTALIALALHLVPDKVIKRHEIKNI
ncbi:MAG: DUF1232 domain-containing protein [Desulfobulbaceae bacterium]|uniref:DUF1232 domain-containing protein n=1 Tax=Candidatus Desulfobia pelagia TaxID=2841692 RepID=A0A8J6TCJ4_9BACT|nr:DUF1232 domain-containing protein [Candidatus Desulfobia pelagia]